LAGHLGAPLPEVVVVTRNWAGWEHAYLAEHGTAVPWFGIAGGRRTHGVGIAHHGRRLLAAKLARRLQPSVDGELTTAS
jgi:hypothetical protein